ncbi:MAG: 23S rRNA (adenine(2503)-C(2))-methyltransferase RlmN [candidate division Zixibacteria bacterium]|jgi:23S rRNA (adenine2503-C2)-methyltransferase|nr:23S rRNA (adenine(2503)-C(2))-methyltransferase RlmN [candidate division Zixibacteria bacterium]
MAKTNLIGYTRAQLESLFADLGEKPFRGRQLYKWIYQIRQTDFAAMTDLTRTLRERLAADYTIDGLFVEHRARSADGTEKFLFRLHDGHPVESVLIPDDERGRSTVCISSQAGCALACRFCATGTMGLIRDLTVGEIVGQLLFLRDLYGHDCFTNVVFMGMGEPLNNYHNLIESLQIMKDELGLGIGAKRITVSTSGVTPKIRKLADSGLKVRLALSLHAATQEKRIRLMPIAQTFGLDKLIDAVRYYAEQTKDRVTFEYVLIDDFNDTMDDVLALARLIQGIPCKINLLAYNPVPGLPYRRPSDEKVDWFGRQLYPRAPAVTVRKSRGRDIEAACGQLAARKIDSGVAYES